MCIYTCTVWSNKTIQIYFFKAKNRVLSSPPPKESGPREKLLEEIRSTHQLKPTPGRVGLYGNEFKVYWWIMSSLHTCIIHVIYSHCYLFCRFKLRTTLLIELSMNQRAECRKKFAAVVHACACAMINTYSVTQWNFDFYTVLLFCEL